MILAQNKEENMPFKDHFPHYECSMWVYDKDQLSISPILQLALVIGVPDFT